MSERDDILKAFLKLADDTRAYSKRVINQTAAGAINDCADDIQHVADRLAAETAEMIHESVSIEQALKVGSSTSMPIHVVLKWLVKSADILLHERGYDGPGWETLDHAWRAGSCYLAGRFPEDTEFWSGAVEGQASHEPTYVYHLTTCPVGIAGELWPLRSLGIFGNASGAVEYVYSIFQHRPPDSKSGRRVYLDWHWQRFKRHRSQPSVPVRTARLTMNGYVYVIVRVELR